LPLDAYVALAEVPADEMEQLVTRRVWETAIRALGVVHQGGPSVGEVLARTEYPAARVSALLSSSGDTLVRLIAEVVRWLVSHDVERASLTDLVVLGLADASNDRPACDEAVTRIALAYTRARKRERAAA